MRLMISVVEFLFCNAIASQWCGCVVHTQKNCFKQQNFYLKCCDVGDAQVVLIVCWCQEEYYDDSLTAPKRMDSLIRMKVMKDKNEMIYERVSFLIA